MRSSTWKLFLVAFFVHASVQAATGLKAKGIKVYRGGNGVKISVVRLDKGTEKEALVQVEGTDSDLDGAVLLAEITEWDGNEDYKARWKDRRSVIITQRGGSFEFYVPGKNGNGIGLGYDRKLSEKAKPETVISAYEAKQGGK